MPSYRRHYRERGSYFFTVVTHHRQKILHDDEDFERCMNYVHINSVQHGYVKRPVDWLYSTFHRCVKLGIYTKDWGSEIELMGEFSE
jgi:REP element-mobilizing transposase RayT